MAIGVSLFLGTNDSGVDQMVLSAIPDT